MWQTVEVEKENLNLNINSLRNATRPVRVHAESYDRFEGNSLTSKTKFFISYRGKWVLMDSVPSGSLKSGSVVKILEKCEGYEDAFYSLNLNRYQDELFLKKKKKKLQDKSKAKAE